MKRSRAPNFTNGEIMHLLQLTEKYPSIKNKKTDSATTRDKHESWQALAMVFNSTTTGVPRTAENLLACYKNQKIKAKKQYSNEKLSIKAPQQFESQPGSSSQTYDVHNIIWDAVEENGQNWDSKSTKLESKNCEIIIDTLVKQEKKEDADYVKDVKRTGGGPPPQPPYDAVLEKAKIGPSLEGMYTVHGGDYEYMKQQQDLLPAEKKNQTIEQASLTCNIKTHSTIDEDLVPKLSPLCRNTTGMSPRRLDLLRKKVKPTTSKGKLRKTAAASYLELAEDKKELIKIKTTLASNQLLHQQEINAISLEIAKEKQEFEKKKNELELNYMREKYHLELQLIRDKK